MKVDIENLERFCNEILYKIGLDREDREIVTDYLITVERLGISSHGVIRLVYYYRALKDGYLNPKPRIRILNEDSATVLIDGDHGLGQVIAAKATRMAIEKAKRGSIGFGNAINLGHVGALSYYTLMAVREGFVSVAITNAPAVMAPLGGKRAFLGTNPVSLGIPFKDGEHFLFDGSMSAASRGKIMLAMQRGEKIPENWALNERGEPTTDPAEAIKGALLPDGVRGYAIALFIDLFCGSVLGGKFGYELPSNFASQGGFSILVINPRFFRPYEEHLRSFEKYVERLRSHENAKLPGEIEFSKFKESIRSVEIDEAIISKLNELARELGCDLRL